MLWDIFCKVIDNHGDIGVCWRLAAELARRGERARLWVDAPAALAWMAPQGQAGVEVRAWTAGSTAEVVPGDVVVEAFGCEPGEAFAAAIARRTRERGRQPAWINLEYLSAEPWVERCHGLPSPVMAGPAKGLVKRFFYPGFTPRTGGLIRERDFDARQAAFDRTAWLRARGLPDAGERLVSLFCYEPPALPRLLAQLAAGDAPTRLLVTAGRAQAAVQAALADSSGPAAGLEGRLAISYLPLLTQTDYDHLLWACDLNFVRGEDSLVRALWAGRPFVWQIYPQHDDAHHAKLRAFLDWLRAPASLRAFHEGWNGIAPGLPAAEPATWAAVAQDARQRLRAQPELVEQLGRTALESQ
ncbi:Conserved hypothetical protein [Ramlibacter tataouinensis TTB310]|uniref:Protein-arginine rhamnosyltransferase n=2 Tax=Ramlibacter tataouinensis TaxID=94132 RepID=F5Y1W6_RAMTT|nr:Conserved hypothetical protein [Ramlibacter tataouinensis TTB310]